jgi:hypothetical protein
LPQDDQSTLWSRLLGRLGPAEAVIFWAVALAYLLPVWAFRYVPTQDGPGHLFNAQLIKDYGHSAAGYERYFEVRSNPLPNWTSHLLLAGLFHLFAPLTAEKVLVSLYVLGFAGTYRYFLGAFGERCRPLSWAGLLFIYNRCFWLGFYNYCLGLVLFWAILGYCLRRRETMHLPQAAVLMVLLTAAYFTHLAAFLLSWAGAFLATLRIPPRYWQPPVLVCLAGLPAACLTIDYFETTGFFRDRMSQRLVEHPLTTLRGKAVGAGLWKDLSALDSELFECHAGAHVTFGLLLLPYYALLALFTAVGSQGEEVEDAATPGWLFPFLLGMLLFAAYFLVPASLDPHGGFLKTRLALLPPLLLLACLRELAQLWMRLATRGVVLALLAANLFLVLGTAAVGNQALAQYTAGAEAVGRGFRLFVVQPERQERLLADPLLHASNYYCLGTDGVNLNNYETDAPHFPVRFRPAFRRGRGNWAAYPNQDVVDVVLCWQTAPRVDVKGPPEWPEVFRQGPLRIYRRPE